MSQSEQMRLGLVETRARKTDPATSHEAAADSYDFSHAHCRIILLVLEHACQPLTFREIAQRTCGPRSSDELEPVQVGKRVMEMREAGMIRLCEARPCSTTGRRMSTYVVAEAPSA